MSEISRQIHEQAEFSALAPQYLQILERLSDEPTLKFVFWSMGKHFESPREQYEFETLMRESDEDAAMWHQQIYDYEHGKRQHEHRKKQKIWRSARSEIGIGELLQSDEWDSDDSENLRLSDDAARILHETFPKQIYPYSAVRLFVYHEKPFLIVSNQGSTIHTVTEDKNKKLALGDKFHTIYLSEGELAGCRGAGNYILDELGREKRILSFEEAKSRQPSKLERENIKC